VAVSPIAEVWDLTTVAEDEVVFHLHSPETLGTPGEPGGWEGTGYEVISGLSPGTPVLRHGIGTRTLDRPPGELLCRFATVNDVHFGETECGKLSDVVDTIGYLSAEGIDAKAKKDARDKLQAFFEQLGPVVENSSPEGATPYPELMSRAAVTEIAGIDPAAVVVKGDLTSSGLLGEYDAFLQCYLGKFGDRLLHVRGNHDAFTGRHFASEPCQEMVLPGVIIALVDTVIEGRDSGQFRGEQLEWLDELSARADRPVSGLFRDQPERLRTPCRGDREASGNLRVLRRTYAPQPCAEVCPDRWRPLRRGRVRQGLPGELGGVPGLRGRDPAGPPPAVLAGSARLVREVPRAVLGDVSHVRAREVGGPLLFDHAP
jgi:hypothetical protein